MALGPINSPAIQPIQPAPPRDIEGLRRAFFQAALNTVEALAAPPAAAAAEPAPAAQTAAEPEPRKGYRPGSLLDIRV